MGALYLCSSCCMVLSIWGVIQMLIMGIAYKLEATVLVEDVIPHGESEEKDLKTLIKDTKDNFFATAINCWIVGAIYLVTLALSCIGLRQAKKKEKRDAVRREDDEYSCQSNELM